jgi:protein-tyrosine phosphatase
MAVALLVDEARARGVTLRVESAGIGALVGQPADDSAIELMAARGLDISAHRARQVTAELVSSFELVLAMDTDHQRVVETKFPTARGRVHRLGRARNVDVPDPHRQGRAAFERSLDIIERSIAEMGPVLWGRAQRTLSATA